MQTYYFYLKYHVKSRKKSFIAQENGLLDNSLPNHAHICMCLRIKTYHFYSCVLFDNADGLHRCVVLLHSKKKIALR